MDKYEMGYFQKKYSIFNMMSVSELIEQILPDSVNPYIWIYIIEEAGYMLATSVYL